MGRCAHHLLALALLCFVAAPAWAQGPAATDLYGDPLPQHALARLGTVRFRHEVGLRYNCSIHAIAYSPDGKLLASAAEDRTVRFWDVATGKQRMSLRLDGVPKAVAFAPKGQTLALGGTAGELRLIAVATGQTLRRLNQSKADVLAVAFSSDGKTLAAAGADRTVRLWTVATGQETFVYKQHAGAVFWVAFTNQDKTVVSGSDDGSVRFWEAATGKELDRFQSEPKALHCLALSPDGTKLAIGTEKRTVVLWDVQKGDGPRLSGNTLRSDGRPRIAGLAFSPDGKCLVGVGASWVNAISVWDVATAKEVQVFRGQFMAGRIAFAPDGQTVALATSHQTVRFLDLTTGKERLPVVGQNCGVEMLAVSPDGSRVATAGMWDTTLLWDAATGKLLHAWDISEDGVFSTTVRQLAFSHDGQMVAAALDSGAIVLWSVATGKKLAKLQRPKGNRGSYQTRSLHFTPDDRTLIAAGEGLRVYDVAAGKHSRDLQLTPATVAALAPDGRTLAVPGNVRLTLWDLPTDKEVRQFAPGGKYVFAQFVGPAELLLIDLAHNVGLWDTKSGKLVRQGYLPLYTSYAASRDGRFIATGCLDRDNEEIEEVRLVRVWEVATSQEVARLDGHTGKVGALAFTPDCRRLVSGSFDCTALVWDLTNRLKAGKLQPATLDANALAGAWADLAGAKAKPAYAAVWALVATPTKSVPFLAKRLARDPKTTALVQRWIADLADDRDETRTQARQQLLALGAVAVPALQKTLKSKPPIQVQERVTQLLKELEPARHADLLRSARAILVLEQIGSREACQVLRQLADSGADETVIPEATAALARLTSQP